MMPRNACSSGSSLGFGTEQVCMCVFAPSGYLLPCTSQYEHTQAPCFSHQFVYLRSHFPRLAHKLWPPVTISTNPVNLFPLPLDPVHLPVILSECSPCDACFLCVCLGTGCVPKGSTCPGEGTNPLLRIKADRLSEPPMWYSVGGYFSTVNVCVRVNRLSALLTGTFKVDVLLLTCEAGVYIL